MRQIFSCPLLRWVQWSSEFGSLGSEHLPPYPFQTHPDPERGSSLWMRCQHTGESPLVLGSPSPLLHASPVDPCYSQPRFEFSLLLPSGPAFYSLEASQAPAGAGLKIKTSMAAVSLPLPWRGGRRQTFLLLPRGFHWPVHPAC